MITTKRVLRFYAPYKTLSGRTAQKGFTTLSAAARFLAKQDLFDKVFGEKYEHDDSFSADGRTMYELYQWRRDVPDDKEERVKMFAEHFPLEECECPLGYDQHDYPYGTGGCEEYGYARCQSRFYLQERWQHHMREFKKAEAKEQPQG